MLSTSTHVFSEIFIHLNWHCKADYPLITEAMEPALHQYLENYCQKTKGIQFLGVGGTEDHIHLCIQMEPFVCLADWVGKIKGASSHEMNDVLRRGALQWQRGYGAVSFAKRDLEAVQRYVENQKEHHRRGSMNATLEQFGQFMEIEPEC